MADRTTSQLDAATTLSGGEVFPGVQDGVPKKFTPRIIRGDIFNTLDYGAIADNDPDSATSNTNGFIAACNAIEANGGGTLVIAPGTYYVGKQDFAGQQGLNYAYRGYHIIEINNCTAPVKVIAAGVKFIWVAGLHFGSFDPVTGLVFNPPPGVFTNGNYAGSMGKTFYFNNNAEVEVVGPCIVDGNISNMVIGGRWGDTGIQLSSDGCEAHNNSSFICRQFYAHHMGRDGFQTGHSTQTLSGDPRPVYFDTCRALYNGRNGWSIVGGIQTTGVNCDFSHNGKGGYSDSSPKAGVDIENEGQGIRNVTFINCRMNDNGNTGVVSDGTNAKDIQFHNCLIVGTTNYATWLKTRGVKFFGGMVVGANIAQYDGTNEPEHAFEAWGTRFSMVAADSPSGVVYSSVDNDFVNAKRARFHSCVFDSSTFKRFGFTSQDANLVTFDGCYFRYNNGRGDNAINGIFVGRNYIDYTGTLSTTTNPDFINRGTLVINGVEQLRGTPVVDTSGGVSITSAQTGTVFHNNGATVIAPHILPTGEVGLEYGFYIDDAQGISVSAQSGATIQIGTQVGDQFESTTIGSFIWLTCISTTKWVTTRAVLPDEWAPPPSGDYWANRYFAPRYSADRYYG